MKNWYTTSGLFLLLTSCTGDIGEQKSSDTGAGVSCDIDATGVVTTTVNSTSEEDWVYFDFETCGVTEEVDSEGSWDVAFLRFNPKINGGVSGSGGVEVAILEGVDFDAIETAPSGSYVVDVEDEDDDGMPEFAMKGWYDYDFSTHILTPAGPGLHPQDNGR